MFSELASQAAGAAIAAAAKWGTVRGLGAAHARVQDIALQQSVRKVTYYYFYSDVLALVFLNYRAQVALCGNAVSVCGDTLVGNVIRVALERFGRRTLPFRFRDRALAIRDVKAMVSEPAPISISADGLGRAGVVDEGLARLLQSRGGVAVPVSVRAMHAASLSLAGRLTIPLPGAALSVVIGRNVLSRRDIGEFTAELQAAILAASIAADALAAPGQK